MWAQTEREKRREEKRREGFGYECLIVDAVGIICGKESILIGVFKEEEGYPPRIHLSLILWVFVFV